MTARVAGFLPRAYRGATTTPDIEDMLLRCALLLAMMLVSLPARAGLLEPFVQKPSFPGCHDEAVLGDIVERFNWAEEKTWHRGFGMSAIGHVRETTVEDHADALIPRRYCRARAQLTNGHHRTIYFLVEGGAGFAGNKFNVEYCVSGLDPWREFNGHCRTLRH